MYVGMYIQVKTKVRKNFPLNEITASENWGEYLLLSKIVPGKKQKKMLKKLCLFCVVEMHKKYMRNHVA